MANNYPRLEINISHLEDNVRAVLKRCGKCGVELTGVIKGANGIPEVTRAYAAGGISSIGSSRREQIKAIKELNLGVSVMLIRMPMPWEVADTVAFADVSLNTDMGIIRALDAEAARQKKLHRVILMADVGDLREGYWDLDELLDAAEQTEKLKNVELAGVGTNVGCYGSIEPTVETMEKLSAIAEKIEAKIGRKLDIISGGASSSLMRIWDEDMPPKINHLRVGGEIMLAYTNRVVYGYDMSDLHYDAFVLKAEVSQVKRKPSPENPALRKKALLNVGLVDYGNADGLHPRTKGIEIEKAFWDYTLIDVEDAEEEYKPGSIVTFDLSYGALVYLTKSRSVKVEIV